MSGIELIIKRMQVLNDEVREIESRAAEEKRDMSDSDFQLIKNKYLMIEKLQTDAEKIGKRQEIPAFLTSNKLELKQGLGVLCPKNYRDLFGQPGNDTGGFDSIDHFLQTIRKNPTDTRLKYSVNLPGEKRAQGQGEAVPSLGGFQLPENFLPIIFDTLISESVVLPRARVFPMSEGNVLKVPALEIGSHASTLWGGIGAYWTNEAGSLTSSSYKTRLIELVNEKLACLTYSTNELSEDALNFDSNMTVLIAGALAFYSDYAYLAGDGSGKPLGILNSPCAISITKETSQEADTICTENLWKMISRMYSPLRKNAVFIANDDTLVQLLSLSLSIGVSASWIPALTDVGQSPKILGIPVIFSELMPTLGDSGDISLVDFSQYWISMRKNISIASSPDVAFITDEKCWRGILRTTGTNSWDSALTPKKSSNTLSNVVKIDARG